MEYQIATIIDDRKVTSGSDNNQSLHEPFAVDINNDKYMSKFLLVRDNFILNYSTDSECCNLMS